MGVANSANAKPVTEPAPTITTGGASSTHRPGCARPALLEPLIAPYYGGGSGRTSKPASEALDAVTTKARFGVAEPIVVQLSNQSSQQKPRGADQPLRTITGSRGGDMAVATPMLEPEAYRIDILYRMLHWRELARAMSFDDEGEVYQFAGNATEIVKQIGNAVPGRTAKALVRALMAG
jgi:DNA (cytosine-5)-methyltransferase 1